MSWDMNNLYEWTLLKNLVLLNGSKIYLILINILYKNGMKIVIQDIFLNSMFNILKDNIEFAMIYNCYLEE